jgi:hypothetical protein
MLTAFGASAQDAALAKPTEPVPAISGVKVTQVVLVRSATETGFAVRLAFLTADGKVAQEGTSTVVDLPETTDVNEFDTFADGLLTEVPKEPKDSADKIAFRALKMLEQRGQIPALKQ